MGMISLEQKMQVIGFDEHNEDTNNNGVKQ